MNTSNLHESWKTLPPKLKLFQDGSRTTSCKPSTRCLSLMSTWRWSFRWWDPSLFYDSMADHFDRNSCFDVWIIFCLTFSVWVHHHFCRCLPSRSNVGSPQQYHGGDLSMRSIYLPGFFIDKQLSFSLMPRSRYASKYWEIFSGKIGCLQVHHSSAEAFGAKGFSS